MHFGIFSDIRNCALQNWSSTALNFRQSRAEFHFSTALIGGHITSLNEAIKSPLRWSGIASFQAHNENSGLFVVQLTTLPTKTYFDRETPTDEPQLPQTLTIWIARVGTLSPKTNSPEGANDFLPRFQATYISCRIVYQSPVHNSYHVLNNHSRAYRYIGSGPSKNLIHGHPLSFH